MHIGDMTMRFFSDSCPMVTGENSFTVSLLLSVYVV
jgi:hypothetical protein